MKTSKIAFLMLILLVVCLPWVSTAAASAAAEAANIGQTLQGTVYYSTTPVAGIQINLHALNLSNPPIATTVSDNAGHYVLTNISAGTYFLEVSSPTNDWVGMAYYLPQQPGQGSDTLDVYVRKNITVLQPKADAVLPTLHPVFCWQHLAEAVRYSLQIDLYDGGSLVEYQANIPSTCYETSSSLKVGSTYQWFLSAWDADGREIGLNYAYSAQKFQIKTLIFLPSIAK